MGSASSIDERVFQIKITLKGVSKPPVWRRILVPAGIRLDHFHDAIQAAMGWLDYHMHVFSAEAGEYGVPDPDLGHRDERQITLARVLQGSGDRLIYTYDFGDDWDHELAFEQEVPAEPGAVYPRCVAGKGACPPEDCGGPWGYMDLRAVLADPGAESHDEMLEWLGLQHAGEFDPAAFDVDAVNESLAALRAVR
ncbi:MAG TPA: plasmid pRiA4b ORF-3 family protein [Solirubrobacteraceae bacterium]|nr:plasmid pRiA4b ORF-3 family protein [Solirubrobacteraceae bacterium]